MAARILLAILALCFCGDAAAQGLRSIPLSDLSAFRPVGRNWQVVGTAGITENAPGRLTTAPGTGVLLCVPGKLGTDNLFTRMEHSDLEIELEWMVPRSSNSGVYLMGRYEVQVFDSFGQKNPGFSDAGGIYQRWDPQKPEPERGYEGHAPRVNASRPAGEWQHYRILFRGPRFDANGRKTENARFIRVEHNGVVVQENVEVTGPTRAAAFTDERPTGPLMLQGDHGPVAYRNIRYRVP